MPETKLQLPVALPNRGHIWNQFMLRVRGEGRRDSLKAFLGEKSIGSEIYYPVPLHVQECFNHVGAANEEFAVANRSAREVLSIPIFPDLDTGQLDEVITAIAEWLKD